MKKTIALFISILFFTSCSAYSNWTGFYYPDADNIGDESLWKIQPGFETIDDCRDWIKEVSIGNNNFDYECGYGCRYEKEYEMNICKETIR